MKLLLTYIFLTLSCAGTEHTQYGIASWYGRENRISSTGKKLTHDKPALAHKTYPIGSYVKVTDIKSKKSVTAIVEDRGPYIKSRVVDLNSVAAKQLNIISSGLCRVKVELLKKN